MADFTALKNSIQTYIKQNGNEEITGEILQEILLSMVTTLGDSAINDLITALANEVAARQNADGTLQQRITNEATARGNADTALQNLIDGITDNIENGYVYAGIATPSSTPTTGKVFYLALTAGTYTNFGNTVVSQGINILKYNGSAWSLDAFIGIDDTPTPNSPKLVKSGGVLKLCASKVFDINGKGYTGVSINVQLAAGHKYIFYPIKKDWEYTSYASMVLQVDAYINGSYVPEIYEGSVSDIQNSYEFIAKDAEHYRIFVRADIGKKASFSIVDKTILGDVEESIKKLKIRCNENLVPITMSEGWIATNGETVDVTDIRSHSPQYYHAIVSCNEGDIFIINGVGGGTDRLWCFTDASYNVLQNARGGITGNNTNITAPKNAAYLIINDEGINGISYKGACLDYLIDHKIGLMLNETPIYVSPKLSILRTDSGYDVSISSLLFLYSSGDIVYKQINATYHFTQNTILAYRKSSDELLMYGSSGYQTGDAILLDYDTNLGFVSGLICGNYYIMLAQSSVVVAANGVTDIGNYISWDSLSVRLKNGKILSFNANSIELLNTRILVIDRNGNLQLRSSLGNISMGDTILAYRRSGKIISGELIPYLSTNSQPSYKDDAELNVYRKGMQLERIAWTPKLDVEANEGTHPAGVETHGIPYSSVKEYLKFVGIDVSIHTFMTAVNDIHSLLYTEKVGENDSQSAYGRTYHGVNSISYFGNVCSAFVTSALGLDVQYNSWEYKTMPLFTPLDNQNERNLLIGDVLSEPGHCSVVTKIERDENGEIKMINISEQAAAGINSPIKTTRYTLNNLHLRKMVKHGVYCRYKELYNNCQYKTSPFILLDSSENVYNVDDFAFVVNGNTTKYYKCITANRDAEFTPSHWQEVLAFNPATSYNKYDCMYYVHNGKVCIFRCLVQVSTTGEIIEDEWEINNVDEWASYPYTYNNDIVTFAGDRAAFKENDLIYINYNLGSYTAMELYKNEVLIQTIPLSSGYQVNVSSYCSGKGFYKARLIGNGTYSRYTYFEVIETNVSASVNNSQVVVSFASSNGKPIDLQIIKDSGYPLAHYALSEKDIANGVINVNPEAMSFAQRPDVTPYSGDAYVRVVFEGEYGNVANEMISIGQFDTGSGIIVKPDVPLDAGEVITTSFILDGELDGKTYQLSFYAEASDVVVSVVPTIGTIYWKQSIPQTLVPGERYLVKVINGVGECL